MKNIDLDHKDNFTSVEKISTDDQANISHRPYNESDALSVLERVADFAEKIRLGDYLEAIQNPRRMIFLNFLYGVARGIGLAIGFTLLGAFIVYLLNQLQILNLPLIGDFITELLKYIDKTYGARV